MSAVALALFGAGAVLAAVAFIAGLASPRGASRGAVTALMAGCLACVAGAGLMVLQGALWLLGVV